MSDQLQDLIDQANGRSDRLKQDLKKVESNRLYADNDTVKLGTTVLPGKLVSISVDCEVLMDTDSVSGTAGTKKQLKGFGDSKVSLEVRLFHLRDGVKIIKSKYDMLDEWNRAFKVKDQNDKQNVKVVVYDFHNRHANLRGVKKVVFKQLSSSEDDGGISLSVSFEEYSTVISNTNKNTQSKTTTGKEKTKQQKEYETKKEAEAKEKMKKEKEAETKKKAEEKKKEEQRKKKEEEKKTKKGWFW